MTSVPFFKGVGWECNSFSLSFGGTLLVHCVILSVGRLRRRLTVSPTMVGGDGTTPVVLGRRLADDRCR